MGSALTSDLNCLGLIEHVCKSQLLHLKQYHPAPDSSGWRWGNEGGRGVARGTGTRAL